MKYNLKKEKYPLRKKIIADSIWNLGATMIARLGGLIFTIIAARLLMPEGYGQYSLALSIAIIFMTFADLGINQALMTYVSLEIDKNKKKAAAYFHYLFKIKVILATIVSMVILLSSYPLANFIFKKPELFPLLVILSFYAFFLIISGFFESSLYIKNKVRYITIKEAIFQFLRLITFILVVYFVSKIYYVVGAIFGLTIAAFFNLVVIFLFYRKTFYLEKPEDYEQYLDKKRILKFIGFLTIANLSSAFFSYIDIVMLGLFVSSENIGYYKAAIGLIFAIAGTLSFSGIFLSVMTKIKKKNIQGAFDKIINYLLVLLIPAIIGLIMLSKYIFVMIYGYAYLPAASLMILLAPLLFFMAFVSLFLNLLSSREKTKEFAFFTLFCTVLNIILNYAFIKFFLQYSQLAAIRGVAIATLISWIIYFFGTLIISQKQVNVHFNYKLLIKPILASIIMGIFLYTFNKITLDMTPLIGLFEVAIAVLVYFIVLILIGGVRKEDLRLIYDYLFPHKKFIRLFLN